MTDTTDLITEYGRLRRLESCTPQTRGQRFNGLIAEMLRRNYLRAQENVRGAGEIDVTFTVETQRFVLEAKWEKDPISTGAIAKLQKRVRQRLGGTIGVFLSMSGYTPEAIADVKDGDRLEVLLLDSSHFEAMLSGFVPPVELMEAVIDYASYRGDAYVDLNSLLADRTSPETLRAVEAEELDRYIVAWYRGARPSVAAAFEGFPFGQSGLSASKSGDVLVATNQGIFRLEYNRSELSPLVRVKDCHGPAILRSEGLYVSRRHGVARVNGSNIHILAGGSAADPVLLESGSGDVLAIYNTFGGTMDRPGPPCLESIPDQLGDPSGRVTLAYPTQGAMNAAAFSDGTRLIVGSGGVLVESPTDTKSIGFNGANAMGLCVEPTGKVACVADTRFVSIFSIDIARLESHELGQLDLAGSISHLIRTYDGYFLMSHSRETNGNQPKPTVLWLKTGPQENLTDGVG